MYTYCETPHRCYTEFKNKVECSCKDWGKLNDHLRKILHKQTVGETMGEHKIILRLNQQQLELIHNTVEKGEAQSSEALIQRALREYSATHKPSADGVGK